MNVATLRAMCLLLAALTVSGCVNMDPVEGRVLSTRYEQRFTDEAIRRDWRAMEALRGRIDALRPENAGRYELWRAELMLSFGVHEYQENDRTTIADALLDDAHHMALQLEPGYTGVRDLSLPTLPAVKVLREDLWTTVQQSKQNAALRDCAGEQVARLEVGLLELGHNHWEVDAGMNTIEHIDSCPFEPLVDDLAAALLEATAACTPTLELPLPDVQSASLPAEVMFRFDSCSRQDILPEGFAQLDLLGETLALEQRGWRQLVVTGHTDRLGRMAYNLELSRCRAETVRDYLVERFEFPPERVEARGLGPLEPVTFCSGPIDDALKACLQPNRRVDIRVQR